MQTTPTRPTAHRRDRHRRNVTLIRADRRITWRGTDGTAFVSDLLPDTAGRRLLRRVWDDAADVGFVLESTRTGRRVLFLLSDVVHESDGSTTLKLTSYRRPQGRPDARTYTLTLYGT